MPKVHTFIMFTEGILLCDTIDFIKCFFFSYFK